MTLFELQAWLGHRSPQSTQYYAKITPNTLSKAYSEVGNFERNVRTIEVLFDRDAVTTGAAATGEPWQHYDLGHGYCTYTFFEQCQHRRVDRTTRRHGGVSAAGRQQRLLGRHATPIQEVACPETMDPSTTSWASSSLFGAAS
ncbi:hypothetical protein [Streptomyces sp. NBC_01014]|uniref:hypothetical protein n=1 Tax=Streptomyces sp. NBC_01014 TaxID=2903719 RepID=UPI00386844B8|nr:hypothetical protein OG282_34345 [Streptomyces sp. NBC_01014]